MTRNNARRLAQEAANKAREPMYVVYEQCGEDTNPRECYHYGNADALDKLFDLARVVETCNPE